MSDDAPGDTIPTPGSAEAKAAGCSCPVTAESTGDGYVVRGEVVTYWWQDEKCPLHGFGTGYKWDGGRPEGGEGHGPESIEGGRPESIEGGRCG